MSEHRPSIERVDLTTIEPKRLATVRADLRASLPTAVEALDRRGFRLLHWPPIRANAAGKPIELSLEHEARLRPNDTTSALDLQRHLDGRQGRELLPDDPVCGDLVVRRVERAPGAQSIDRYWDVEGRLSGGFTTRMASFRQRIKTSKFMTWSGGEATDAPGIFNLELPLVALGAAGVVARLEFNWIDALETANAEFAAILAGGAADPRNPLAIALRHLPGGLAGPLRPALEHTTFRRKYALLTRAADGGEEKERFQLNIDHMIVQSLRTGRFAHHVDVDVAAAVPVDTAVLAELDTLASALSDRFSLRPADAPKVWRGARALDELG